MRTVIVLNGEVREEGSVAVGSSPSLKPGMLVELVTDGVQAHSAAGGPVAPVMFVREQREHKGDELQDEDGVEMEIADGESCVVIYPTMGTRINAYCPDTVDRGDHLTSDGNGGLKKATSDDAIVGVATEHMADNYVACVIGAAPGNN